MTNGNSKYYSLYSVCWILHQGTRAARTLMETPVSNRIVECFSGPGRVQAAINEAIRNYRLYFKTEDGKVFLINGPSPSLTVHADVKEVSQEEVLAWGGKTGNRKRYVPEFTFQVKEPLEGLAEATAGELFEISSLTSDTKRSRYWEVQSQLSLAGVVESLEAQ